MPTPKFTDFETMTQRYITGRQTLADLYIRLATLNDKLIMDMSRSEYSKIVAERDRIAEQVETLKVTVRSLKVESERLRAVGKTQLFRDIASQRLPRDLFAEIEDATELMWSEDQKAANSLLSGPNPLAAVSETCGRIKSKAKKRREQRNRQRAAALKAKTPKRYRR